MFQIVICAEGLLVLWLSVEPSASLSRTNAFQLEDLFTRANVKCVLCELELEL